MDVDGSHVYVQSHFDDGPKVNLMPFPRNSKRKRDESDPPLRTSSLVKKHKQEQLPNTALHPRRLSNPHYPREFYKGLSKIELTERALEDFNNGGGGSGDELYRHYHLSDGSNNHEPSGSSCLQILRAQRPITRWYLAKRYRDFAEGGGPDLQDLRGYPCPSQPVDRSMSSAYSSRNGKRGSVSTSSSRRTSNTTATKKTGTSGAYDRNFTQHLVDHGIYSHGYKFLNGSTVPKPSDWEEFKGAISKERASLSPSQFSEDEFEQFVSADADIVNEGDAMRKIVPFIQGTKWDERRVQRNVLFSNLAPLTDGTLKNAKPDLYYGGRPEQLRRAIRQDLSQFIVPSTADNLPIAPNMFLEAKGPDGSAAVAQRQACYDGALGARGMQELLFYRREEQTFDSKIKAVSSTYHNGQLKLYAHHITQPNGPGTRPELFMNQANAWSMTGNKEGLKNGLKGFRNAVDWADRQREEAISSANALFDRDERDAEVSEEATEDVVSDATDTSEDENWNDNRENADEDDESAHSAPPRQLLTSFMSASQASGTHSSSRTDARAQEDPETSTDELAAVVPVPAKRRSRSQRRSMSKRRARASSSSGGPRRNGR